MRDEINFRSLLLGTAVGDALGLPAEGLSAAVIRRRWNGVWKMRLVAGRGMVSDDTEHAVMTVLSLMATDDVTAFRRDLAGRIKVWFACLPPGVGLATARSCIRLWLGVDPARSGVWSAGNGPAMRGPVIGAWFAHDAEKRRSYVSASTRLTHTDPRAEIAALAVAETAAWLIRKDVPREEFLVHLAGLSEEEEWQSLMTKLRQALFTRESLGDFVKALGLTKGITGYAYHTVPAALFAVLSCRSDFRETLQEVLDEGGDTDSVGAIAGALLALRDGGETIPREWLEGLADWPLSVAVLERLAADLRSGSQGRNLLPVWAMIPRNLVLLAIVLGHGMRRLIPW